MVTNDFVLFLHERVLPDAFHLLPGRMNTTPANAMMLAIAMQESRFQHRRQMGNGPAKGFWQFERGGGVVGVLSHELTKPIIVPICELLQYEPISVACWNGIEHNDVLAACFARLLLYTHPSALPEEHESAKGWKQYLDTWRPGKPHPATWEKFFKEGWRIAKGA